MPTLRRTEKLADHIHSIGNAEVAEPYFGKLPLGAKPKADSPTAGGDTVPYLKVETRYQNNSWNNIIYITPFPLQKPPQRVSVRGLIMLLGK